jgi:excisionase family DNA binding protein
MEGEGRIISDTVKLSDPLLAPARLLEVNHVGHRLSVSPGFVRRLIRSHQLPAVRLGGRWRVDEHDLQAFIVTLRAQIAREERALDGRLHPVPSRSA